VLSDPLEDDDASGSGMCAETSAVALPGAGLSGFPTPVNSAMFPIGAVGAMNGGRSSDGSAAGFGGSLLAAGAVAMGWELPV